jgi:hypothetical protein
MCSLFEWAVENIEKRENKKESRKYVFKSNM